MQVYKKRLVTVNTSKCEVTFQPRIKCLIISHQRLLRFYNLLLSCRASNHHHRLYLSSSDSSASVFTASGRRVWAAAQPTPESQAFHIASLPGQKGSRYLHLCSSQFMLSIYIIFLHTADQCKKKSIACQGHVCRKPNVRRKA